MEEKKQWNIMVYTSVVRAMDELIEQSFRGGKGRTASAALLMFLTADPAERQRFVDVISLAEGRGIDGTVLDAAKAALASAEPVKLGGEARPASGGRKKAKRSRTR